MKAKISPRINTEDRTPLQDVIPLSTPLILFIDPNSSCNLKCRFCPNGYPKLIKDTGRFQGNMDFELYKKIINDIKEFNKPLKILRLYKDGEPLSNPNFSSMVRYAKYNLNCYIDTTTNGLLINNNRIKPIIDAGLDKINISVNGLSDEQFLEFTKTKVNFDQYVENIKNLYKIKKNCEIVIKTTGDYLSKDDKNKFYQTFGDYCDRIFIENTANCWADFDVEKYTNIKLNSKKGIYNQPLSNVKVCPYIFYQMCINSDGKASLCFLDWQHKMIIGDVRKQSLKKIWNSTKHRFPQIANLEDDMTDLPLCKECGQLTHGQPDDIDKYKEILKEKCLKEWFS